jgi:hypothetical protein
MKRAGFSVLLMIAVLALVAAVSGDEDRIGEQHSQGFSGNGGWPVGPDITLEEDGTPGLTRTLNVNVNGTPQTVDASLSVFDTTPCRLRGDFVGIRYRLFEFAALGQPLEDSSWVTLMVDHDDDGTDDMRIDIREGDYGTIHWSFIELDGGRRICSNAEAWAGYTEGVIPKEFEGLQVGDMEEATLGTGDEMLLQVYLP